MDSISNGTETSLSRLPKELFDQMYTQLSALYDTVTRKLHPDILEKRLILERLTEAGMWLKMAYDMETQPDITPVMELKNVTRNDNKPIDATS